MSVIVDRCLKWLRETPPPLYKLRQCTQLLWSLSLL